VRAVYRKRRDQLVHALNISHPRLRLAGISAGLHAVAYLPEQGPTEQRILTRAARHDLALHTLGSYRHNPPDPTSQAIIIGYGTPASHAYHPAIDALSRALTQQS
jgi:GntR family transcriptional regulator / MocR family aminotransferase